MRNEMPITLSCIPTPQRLAKEAYSLFPLRFAENCDSSLAIESTLSTLEPKLHFETDPEIG
jgi:hypothetical protein